MKLVVMELDLEKLKDQPLPELHSVGTELAKQMFDAVWWKGLSDRQVVEFQLFTKELTMPLGVFHQALDAVLGRAVWMHELRFGGAALQKEFLGEKPTPTWEQILSAVPTNKQVIVEINVTPKA